MKQINELLGIVIESVYDSLTLYLALIVCILNFLIGRVMHEVLLITIAYMILMRAILRIIRVRKLSRLVYLELILFISAIFSFLTFKHTDAVFFLLGCGYFAICGFEALIRDRKEGYLPEEMKKILILLFISGFLTLYLKSQEYLDVINNTAMFYCLFSIIYLVRTNLIHEYKEASEKINNHSNLVFINALSLFLIIVFIAFQKNAMEYFPYLFLLVVIGVIELLKHIGTVVNWVLQMILAISLRIHPRGYTKIVNESSESSVEELIFQEDILPRNLEDLQGKVEHYEGIKIIVFLIVLALITTLIYFLFKRMNLSLHENLGDPEEKSFIFSKKDLKESVKKRINQVFKRDLQNPIRKRYMKTVTGLIKKGYEMKSGMTPNEYADRIKREDIKLCDDHDLIMLTEKYNRVRYRDGK